jgi:hypothetical protein
MDEAARGFPSGHIRVSDADRDQAISELGQALQDGRITADEFDERAEQVMHARTGSELAVPLADLPAPAALAVAARAGHPPAVRLERGALFGAAALSVVALVRSYQPYPSAETRHALEQVLAQQGIKITIPPPPPYDWAAVLTPAVCAVLLVVTFIVLRVSRVTRR